MINTGFRNALVQVKCSISVFRQLLSIAYIVPSVLLFSQVYTHLLRKKCWKNAIFNTCLNFSVDEYVAFTIIIQYAYEKENEKSYLLFDILFYQNFSTSNCFCFWHKNCTLHFFIWCFTKWFKRAAHTQKICKQSFLSYRTAKIVYESN